MQANTEQEEGNWVGRCESICNQKKLSLRPDYSFEEDTAAKMFICRASLRDIVVQETGTSKKKAKSGAAKLMHKELLKIPEQEAPAKRSKSKEKLSVDKTEDASAVQATDSLSLEIQNELKLRLTEDHLSHENCYSSEKLLTKILSLTDNTMLNKIWPHHQLNFCLDSKCLTDLGPENNQAFCTENNKKCRVFLVVQDRSTKQPCSVFVGKANNVNEARSLSACRALSFLQAKFGIR